jgi:Ser/Thr protein kinase RdoA (MazF antagonist)
MMRTVSLEMALATAVAAAYRFDEAPRCELLVRASNDVVRVARRDRTYWLKLANRTLRLLDELEAEAEVVAELAARGLAVAAPVLRADRRYAGVIELPEGPCPAVLFHDAPGIAVEAVTVAQAEALGALVARIHLAERVPGAARRWRIDADTLAARPLDWIRPWLRQAARDVDALEALAGEMISRAWPRDGTTPLPCGLCHGDLHVENVRFDGAAPTLFDFEVCGIGPCAYDLACYWRKRVALAPPGGDPPYAEWDALLRGYACVRPILPAELRAIPALATLRAIWTMSLPASPHARWGRDWLLDPEYLDAHLAMIARCADSARTLRP